MQWNNGKSSKITKRLLGTLGASLLKNMLAGKRLIRAFEGAIKEAQRHEWSDTVATQANIHGRDTIRAGQDF